ncbi:MAG: hypothetical protein Q8O84_02950 [Nanoarchaeota archaeon]|nr:hypothetical protein [Nanoarchaeota archaeon]
MKILGINFTKLNAEKFSTDTKGIKIGTHIDLSEIREVKADFFSSKEKVLGIKFSYEIDYDPNFAKIKLAGNILVSTDETKFNQILEGWKEKNLPDDFRLSIFNLILKKSSLKALQLEEELNIPLHISMPFLKPQDPKQPQDYSKTE